MQSNGCNREWRAETLRARPGADSLSLSPHRPPAPPLPLSRATCFAGACVPPPPSRRETAALRRAPAFGFHFSGSGFRSSGSGFRVPKYFGLRSDDVGLIQSTTAPKLWAPGFGVQDAGVTAATDAARARCTHPENAHRRKGTKTMPHLGLEPTTKTTAVFIAFTQCCSPNAAQILGAGCRGYRSHRRRARTVHRRRRPLVRSACAPLACRCAPLRCAPVICAPQGRRCVGLGWMGPGASFCQKRLEVCRP